MFSVEDDKVVCHFRENGNPVRTGSPVKLGMTGGDGSPIRSASLSVGDDKGAVGWGWQGVE
ncbi:hypothetical protein COS38_02335 [Candidatus Berkelbacteria bacterium CG03_land_8_20_14_0_80_40_36]|uniref:Uncharacterized protein n=1 Tax=Candidatus Berkelbacteria bacterium CG03_land_8_20_14_0_80_40_36 TaxID=1974509 RepID=A0A2M7CI77_9BACT|nr:MAG: hypothetical protein COS38_02335 [Candidatus Berkelbacteria bacterium CG03_land_8_20_14_0_80_40_36]